MAEEAAQAEFEKQPLDGYVRIVSQVETDQVINHGIFIGGEFFEVRGGRLPPDIYFYTSRKKETPEPDDYDQVLFIPAKIAIQMGLTPRTRHLQYEKNYPAIGFSNPPQGEMLRTGVRNITSQVLTEIRSHFPENKELTIEEAETVAAQPFFTKPPRIDPATRPGY